MASGAAPVAGSTAGSASGPTTRQASVVAAGGEKPVIDWGRCKSRFLRKQHAQCGFLSVPMDYENPSGRKLQLAVSRVKHTTKRFQGVMLTNPGGPGGAGLELVTIGKYMPRHSGASYDWIGFDPRGVGSSKPAVSCRPRYFHANRPAYVPRSEEDVQTWLRRSHGYAKSCAKYGELLDHLRTIDTVRDMDRLRQALGADRINFYGYSYGTYLGQVYATLFADHVRRMVLDSNVDPRGVWYQLNLDQDVAFERAIDVFFRWVAAHHKTYRLGRTAASVRRAYLRERHVLRSHPVGRLGPSELDDAVAVAAYVQFVWPDLARAFALLRHHHNPKPLLRTRALLIPPGDDNEYAMYLATECTDAPWPSEWEQWERDARRLHPDHPLFTWPNTWFNAPCLFWPASPGTPVTVDGHHVSALLVDQTLDAATPFEGSLETRSLFPASRLVAIRGGTTHASTPDLAGRCAAARIAAYLKRGALPPRKPGRRADVSCPAPPLPRP